MTAPSATARAALAAFLLAGPAFAGLAGHPLPAWASESSRFATGQFVRGMVDVPAMPGLAPAEAEPLVFDKPDGRIAQSLMAGPVDRKAVLAFYGRTMPQLGWTPAPDPRAAGTRFLREREELRLEFVGTPNAAAGAGFTTVRFSLIPH